MDSFRPVADADPDGAAQAAARAVEDGAGLIVGPLLASSVDAVRPIADQAGINVVAFSNSPDAAGPPVTLLRSSGIYGPGRGHLFRQFMSGNAAIEGDRKRFLNMVHRDDLVRSIVTALELGNGLGLYNITDDEPVTQLDFFSWLSETTGRPMPPFVPKPEPATRRRGVTNKRVSNKLFKETFGFKYNYPTFREGLTEEIENRVMTP